MPDKCEKLTSNRKSSFVNLLFSSCILLSFFMYSTTLLGNTDIKQLAIAYEEGIDQAVYQTFTGSKEIDKSFFIVKKYLSSRKVKVNPERSRYIEYFISNGQQQLPLIKLRSDKSHDIFVKEEHHGIYIISVGLSGESHAYYRYVASAHSLKKEPENSNRKNVNIKNKFVFSGKDSISVSSDDLSVLEYDSGKAPNLDESERRKVLFQAPESVLKLIGIHETENKRYAFGVGYEEIKPDIPFVWLVEFKLESRELKADVSIHNMDKPAVLDVKRIPSFNSGLALHVQNRKSILEPPENLILNHKLKVVWNNKASKLEGDSLSIAGICNNDFAILRKKSSKKITDSINLSIINSSGKQRFSTDKKMIDNGFLADVMLAPETKTSVITIMNFSKTESVRREDGWYSWEGYKLTRFEFDCD